MTNRSDFETAIARDPHDTFTRMVFADWLDDHDFPEEAETHRQWVRSYLWMREFVKEHHTYAKYYKPPYTRSGKEEISEENVREWYGEFLRFLELHGQGGGYLPFDTPYDFNAYSEEMWQHFETLTGKESPQEEYRYSQPQIRCGC